MHCGGACTESVDVSKMSEHSPHPEQKDNPIVNDISRLRRLEDATTGAVDIVRLPTNTTTQRHPIHRWFNFIAGFSPEFVNACVDLNDQDRSSMTLLDPFVGCGTSPLAARLSGVDSVGYDPHPFFSRIAEAKANSHLYYSELGRIRKTIEIGFSTPDHELVSLSESARKFLGKMFDPRHLGKLCGARQQLESCGLSDNPLAFLALSRILDHACFSSTDGIYKAPMSRKNAVSPLEASTRAFRVLEEDHLPASMGKSSSTIFPSSSEIMDSTPTDSIDVVVTSPPYLNNFDFAEMTRMYLYFWDIAGSWGEITRKVRSALVVNTTTALKGQKNLQASYRSVLPKLVQEEAGEVVEKLRRERSIRAGKKEYDFLVYPYLAQMQRILLECLRVMRPGKPFHMMVSDAALYGVHLPSPQWLAEIMACIGFAHVTCEKVRERGHRWVLKKRDGSEKGLGEYYVFGISNK